MADSILSDLATKILEGLGSLLIQEIGLVSSVKKELRKLDESLSKIKAILLDAEKKGAMNHEVKNWLRNLKDVAYDAEDVLDEFATESLRKQVELPNNKGIKEVRRGFSRSNPLITRWKMAHRIKDIIQRLDRFQKDDMYPTFNQSTIHESMDMNMDDDDHRRHTNPFVNESEVLGREEDKENLVKLLTTSSGGGGNINEENVMVIPIIGLGGLGKTTLAQYVYNDSRVKIHFELQMWVCVSFDFNVLRLAKKILESLTREKCGELVENQVESQLRGKLSGKRYLLVLDDVWNEDAGKWEALRKVLNIGSGASGGSMILVSTRSEKVASIMFPIKDVYLLRGLNKNDCERLFNERAFGWKVEEGTNQHPKLVEIGKAIVKKCGGLPLAAMALGSLLTLTKEEKDWSSVLHMEIWNLEDEQQILPALRISYNQLPSHLKQCFAYCCLFPEDHDIQVDDLIHQWMAHGFVKPPPPPRPGARSSSPGILSHAATLTIEDIGKMYFKELLWRSFFQDVTKDELGNIVGCKMHDLVHNLARSVAGMEWCEVETPSEENIPKGVRHVNLIRNHKKRGDPRNHGTLVKPSLENSQKLRTLYLQSNYGCRFVSSLFRSLRVLSLRCLGMGDVPSSIGYLQQLRYLDLSENHFQALPKSICRLYNLQTLRLEKCSDFKEWPNPSRDMTKMVSLRHLEFESYVPKYMPRGLGKLTSLRTLTFFKVCDPNVDNTLKKISGGDICGLGELHDLNQLRGSIYIARLGNVRDAGDAEKAKLKDKSELQSLTLDFHIKQPSSSISMDTSGVQFQVLENLKPHPNLKRLTIQSYEGVKIPGWMVRSSSVLPNLVRLQISFCENLECLPLIGEFPSLKFLELRELRALKSICNKVRVRSSSSRGTLPNNTTNITATMGGGRAAQGGKPLDLVVLFPLLQQLKLTYFKNLERWTISISEEEEEEESVQHNHMHLLSSICPRLTRLELFEFPKLTTLQSLMGGIQHLTALRILKISYLHSLVSLPDCPAPATLEELYIIHCRSLVRLPDCFFDNLKLLSRFEIIDCSEELTSLPEGIQHLTSLKLFTIGECHGLTAIPEGLGNLSSLQELVIYGCPNLRSLPQGIQHLTSLHTVKIGKYPASTTLPDGLNNLALRVPVLS